METDRPRFADRGNHGSQLNVLHSGSCQTVNGRSTVEMTTSALGRSFGSAEEAAGWMKNILDSSTECSLIATDTEGVIVLWNEGARRLYGYEPDEIIGKPKSV